jgi:hypothetical protein
MYLIEVFSARSRSGPRDLMKQETKGTYYFTEDAVAFATLSMA